MEKELKTRFDEIRWRVKEPERMEGKMLAESVTRKWTEDFVDENSGEVQSIERNEVIIARGKKLTKDDVSRIMFYMQAGEVEDVLVTNQDRPAEYDGFHYGYFEVIAQDPHVKRRLLIYAVGLPMAMQIAIDYCEQVMNGTFNIRNIKQADDYKVLSFKPKTAEDESKVFYAVTVTYWDAMDEENVDNIFLTLAKDADTAIAIVRAYISSDEKRRELYGEDFRITVSKTSPITDVVPEMFSSRYIKAFKTEKYIMDGARVGQMPTT
jgi:hypothetical protein